MAQPGTGACDAVFPVTFEAPATAVIEVLTRLCRGSAVGPDRAADASVDARGSQELRELGSRDGRGMLA